MLTVPFADASTLKYKEEKDWDAAAVYQSGKIVQQHISAEGNISP